MEYRNEAGGFSSENTANPDMNDDGSKPRSYSIPVSSTHVLVIENVTFYMEEYRIPVPRHIGNVNKRADMQPAAEQFYSTMSELPEMQQATNQSMASDDASSCSDDDNDYARLSDLSDYYRTEALQIASFTGKMDFKITVKVIPVLRF